MERADVAVVGGGILGTSVAFWLATGYAKPRGITPTISYVSSLSVSVLPTTSAALPRRRSANPWLRIATRCRPVISSSFVKARP